MWHNIRTGFLSTMLLLFISSGMFPAVAGSPPLVSPEKLSLPVVPAVKVVPGQVRQKHEQAKTRTPARKLPAKHAPQVIKMPSAPVLKAPVVTVPAKPASAPAIHLPQQQPLMQSPTLPVPPVARPTGRSRGFAPPPLPVSKRFGLNKPVTAPGDKSLLPPGVTGGPRHVLEGDRPATLNGRGVSSTVTGTVQPDLIIEDISLDVSRRAVLVKWREAQHRPLAAGSFDWVVGLGNTHMASTGRMREAGDSLRRLSGTNPFRPSSDRSSDSLRSSNEGPQVVPLRSAETAGMLLMSRGTVQVSQGASSGQFQAPLDLNSDALRGQVYLTVKAVLNTGGRYPEANRKNDTLSKQVPNPRHTGRQLAPGEIPSQVISVSSRPARGSEYVTVRYSLSGSRPGRLGIQWKIGGATLPLDCYPNGGDGLTLAPHGLNQQLTFVCQVPVQRGARTDRTENATLTTRFYDGAGRRLPDYTARAVLHRPDSARADAGHPDLGVQIVLAQRYNGKPWVTVRIRNAGNAPSPQSRVVLESSPTDDGACRWPHGAYKNVPVLAPAEVFDATLPGDYCHGEPGTYRVNAQADRINLTARIDSTSDELNLRNNTATRLLKDALRDSPAENLVTRISSVVLTDPPTESANCAYRDAHIRIDGGPFSAPITAELRSDIARSGDLMSPTVRIESGTRLVATTRGCVVLPERRVEIRLHYANDRSSSWQTVQGLGLTEQRRSGLVKEIQEAP
ncbi:hypothetical protein MNBD_GAMMA14-469 [hydrothermal vent metagenome]|uniref:Uncharacterized protein n=1 Tax=hydrothermal vent metagenome TaxID=652676 RepID=A0A3B0ZAD1_9ZZZZ